MEKEEYRRRQAEWIEAHSIRTGSFVKRNGTLQKVEKITEDAIIINSEEVPYTELKAVSFVPLDLRKDDKWIDMVGRKVFSNKDGSCLLITSADTDKVRIDQRWFYPDLLIQAFHNADGTPVADVVEEK